MGSSTSTDVSDPRFGEQAASGEDSVVATVSDQLQSIETLTFRIRDVVLRSYEGTGQPLSFSQDLTHFMKIAMGRLARLRDEDKTYISRELAKDGVTEPDAEDMETMATYVHYARLVYDVDETDVIREALRQAGCDLISHSTIAGSGRAPYFLCFNIQSKKAFLVIRGPPTMSDVLMDLIAEVSVLGEIRASVTAGIKSQTSANSVYVHSDFAKAGRAIMEETIAVLRHLLADQAYTIVIIGHSMGAGVACCIAKMLHDEGVPVTCFGFGTPPCMDKQAALSMAPYCTSIVNHDDLITRASPYAFKYLGELAKMCGERKHATGTEVTAEEALQMAISLLKNPASLKLDQKSDLYVPGKVLFLYWEDCQISAAVKDGTLRTLRRIELTRACLQDHLCEGYIAATQDVAARLAKRPTADYRPWTVQAVFDSGSDSASSGGSAAASDVAEEEEEEVD